MSRLPRMARVSLAAGVALGALLVCQLGSGVSSAAAQTDPTALVGEGGSFLTPVTNLLLNNDTGLSPLNPQYSDSNLDDAIADFAGTGPGDFAADFVVSERPLTSAEAATAAADGRSFAYVPFAATPVAIAVFAICNPSSLTTDSIESNTFCNDMPLTPALVGELLTHELTTESFTGTTLSGWNDPQLTQANGDPIPDPNGIGTAATLSPSAENTAVMALMDSDAVAKADLDNALSNPNITPSTRSDTPSEIWPFHLLHSFVGGDEGLLGHELTIQATTNAPSNLKSWGALGGAGDDGYVHDAFPLSAVWTGAPEGTPWDVPTAAIENAASQFVAPTEAAAAAAQTGAGLTFDPTTNLVTFNAETTANAATTAARAYNNYLMVESYLVVPTTGLAAEKAVKLAQFIRYILGPTGQSEIAVLGAAPATPTEVTAGLQVAAELDAEGSVPATSSSTTGSSTSTNESEGSGAAGTTKPASTVADSGSSGTSASTGSSSDGASAPTLASTGGDPTPLVLLGSAVAVVGAVTRRRLRRRLRRRSVPA